MLKLFSVDDHVIEHPRVWSDRLPAKLRDVGPRVAEVDGREYWFFEDKRGQALAEMGAAREGLRHSERSNEPRQDATRYDEMMPACYDSGERAKDMLANGVVASVCFPSFPRFGGMVFLQFDDKELAGLCVQAYNDFIFDEWCAGGPQGMFVPMALCQVWDPVAAAEEIRRCAARGFRALAFPENTVPAGLPSFYTDHWDPVWRACAETGLVISMHVGSSAQDFRKMLPSPEAPGASVSAIGASLPAAAISNLVFSPVFTKFPDLQFLFPESGIGWIPHALERMDLVWGRYRVAHDLQPTRPSEIWARNLQGTYVEERRGLRFLEFLGANKVFWELDYPHPDTTWPHAQHDAMEAFADAGVSDDDIRSITHANAERLFNWTPAALPATLAA